jgi:hypothetical protein
MTQRPAPRRVADGMRERPRVHPPHPVLSVLGTMSWGPASSRPWTFLTHLLGADRTQCHSSWTSQTVVANAGEARALDAGQDSATFDRSAKDLTCWSPPTSKATDRAVGRSAYAQPEGEPMPLLSSRQLHGRMRRGLFPAPGRRLGISHSIWLPGLPVHLIDKCIENGTSFGGVSGS